jgi:hypothetical protein
MKTRVLFFLGLCALVLFAGCNTNKSVSDTTGNKVVVTRSLPSTVRGGENFTVYLTMSVDGKFNAVGLEEDYPPGWIVSNIPLKGVLKKGPDRVEWLFWPMGEPIMNRTMNYTLTAPSWYSGSAPFSGKVIVKTNYAIVGDSSVNVVN